MMTSKQETLRKLTEGRLLAENLTNEEKGTFSGPDELKEYEKILRSSANWSLPLTDTDASWTAIQSRIGGTVLMQRRRWLSIAASILLLAIAAYFLIPAYSMKQISTGYQEIKSVKLPDGSIVTLNAVSSLKYSESWDDERIVWLEGKARFDVRAGERFVVESGEYRTVVLGTSFDVQYDDSMLEVSCYSGSVSVRGQNSELVLAPGERALAGEGKSLEKAQFNAGETGKWVSGEFYFEGAPFMRVVAELERQFGLEVRGVENDQRLYRGYFYADNLVEALDLVFRPMGYDYRINENIVIVK